MAGTAATSWRASICRTWTAERSTGSTSTPARVRGLLDLEKDRAKQAKARPGGRDLDFIDIYAELTDNDKRRYRRRYPEEADIVTGFLQRARDEGREQGMRQGRAEGERAVLELLLRRRFGRLPAEDGRAAAERAGGGSGDVGRQGAGRRNARGGLRHPALADWPWPRMRTGTSAHPALPAAVQESIRAGRRERPLGRVYFQRGTVSSAATGSGTLRSFVRYSGCARDSMRGVLGGARTSSSAFGRWHKTRCGPGGPRTPLGRISYKTFSFRP